MARASWFLALAALLPLATRADEPFDPVETLWETMDCMVAAADLAGSGDLPGAQWEVDVVLDMLDALESHYSPPAKSADPAPKIAKGIDKARSKLLKARAMLEPWAWSEKSGPKKIGSAAKSLQKLANLAGRPLIAEVDARSAGFHKAGSQVPIAFAIPAGCGTNWDVEVEESEPGVLAYFTRNNETGAIMLFLGSTRGSVRVAVTGCDLPPEGVGRLVYNYGGKPPSGVPEGFPNLPAGTYLVSYWQTWTCTDGFSGSLPEAPVGSWPMAGNLKAFYQQFKTVMDAAVAGVSQPGCTVDPPVYSAFQDDHFTCTVVVSCTACGPEECVTCTNTLVIKVTRL